jgi:adenylate cyclase
MAIAQSNLRYGFEEGAGVDDGVEASAKALELDRTIAEAYCPLARRLAEQDQFEEADVEIGKAMRLNPESWEVNKEAARILFRQRRIEEAAQHFEKAAEVMETDFHAWGMLFSCYQALGNTEGTLHAAKMVLVQVEKVVAEDPDNGAALSFGAASLTVLGQPERAKNWIDRAMLINPENLNMRYNFACNLAIHVKDSEAALDMLEPVFASGGRTVVKLAEADPDMDSLRHHARFIKMVADAKSRLGMADRA